MVFKKVIDFFFEEVEEEENDDYVEEEVVESKGKSFFNSADTIKLPTMTNIELNPVREKEEKKEVFKSNEEEKHFVNKEKDIEFYSVVSKPKTFIDLEDEKPVIKEEVFDAVKPESKAPVRKLEKPVRNVEIIDNRNIEDDFKAVISPVYGVDESTTPKKNNPKEQKSSLNQSYLGTVFSPMYGYVNDQDYNDVKAPVKTNTTKQEEMIEDLPPCYSVDEIIASNNENTEAVDVQMDIFSDFAEEIKEESPKQDSVDSIDEFFE